MNGKRKTFANYLAITSTTAVIISSAFTGVANAVPQTNTNVSALDIAKSIAANPDQVTSASFDSVTDSGTPNGVSTRKLAGFPIDGKDYGVLTSGDANTLDLEENNPASVNNGGDAVRGNTDFDVSILKVNVDVPAGSNCLVGVDFRFLSREYPVYVGSKYNDAFIAELDKSTWTTSGSTISAPDNFAFDPTGDVISINSTGATSMTAEDAAGTVYGGSTTNLTAATPVTPGPHSIYFSIFDQGDRILDSAVLLDNLRFGHVGNVATDCVPGAKPVDPEPPTNGVICPWTKEPSSPIGATPHGWPQLQPGTYDIWQYRPLTISGGIFAKNEEVKVTFGDMECVTRADGNGKIAGISFPTGGLKPGSYPVLAVGDSSGKQAKITVNVSKLSPWGSPSSYYVQAGDWLKFNAHKFGANEKVWATFGTGEPQLVGTTDQNGELKNTTPVQVPLDAADGPLAIVLKGATSGGVIDLTITVH